MKERDSLIGDELISEGGYIFVTSLRDDIEIIFTVLKAASIQRKL